MAGGSSTTSQLVKFEMRLLLGPRAVTPAAEHIDEGELDRLMAMAEEMQP
ncbi:hypothetical protein ACFC18_19180 [Streptomyces sp. NPDC056121]|nr:hypothetical protein [Streptomyces longhuiensis]UDM04605.1 hypothetical protein LGI35_43355 [Streptomyces longhuiensis]